MNLIEKLKTIYDIAKETTYQITIHKRRVIDNYNYAKKHQDQFDKLCHKALKKLNKLPKRTLTKHDISDQLNLIECDIKPHRLHLEACYQDLDTAYYHYKQNGGHTLEEIEEFLYNGKSNTPNYRQLKQTLKLIKMALNATDFV